MKRDAALGIEVEILFGGTKKRLDRKARPLGNAQINSIKWYYSFLIASSNFSLTFFQFMTLKKASMYFFRLY